MSDGSITIRFASDAENEQYLRLKHEPNADHHFWGGVVAARKLYLPALKVGRLGATERQIDAFTKRALKDARKAPIEAGMGAFSDEEWFMYQLGFMAVAYPAKQEALAAVQVGAALVLGAVATALLGPAMTAPQMRSHRQLRPEDFGTLPQGRRSASMPWADRVRRVADHPSRGVGRIHGTGEPPAADV